MSTAVVGVGGNDGTRVGGLSQSGYERLWG